MCTSFTQLISHSDQTVITNTRTSQPLHSHNDSDDSYSSATHDLLSQNTSFIAPLLASHGTQSTLRLVHCAQQNQNVEQLFLALILLAVP
jgi:hypothetical protein